LTEKWNLKSVIGYTDTETVKLDFDNTPFKAVRYWALRTMKWFKLEGFIILKSSKDNYHVVFDRKVSWAENMRIVAWVSLLSHNGMLEKWFVMQCIKRGSTLRMSSKEDKPSPRIVFRYGDQDNQINDFLKYRKIIRNIIKKLPRISESSIDRSELIVA